MVKKSVAILHYAAPPTIGGVESTVAVHARLLMERGYAVSIIAGVGDLANPRIPVHILPDAGSRSRRVSQVNERLAHGVVDGAFTALVQDLELQLKPLLAQCQVLIVHNVLSLHKNLALTAALKRCVDLGGFRLIAWCHDFAWTDPQYADQVHPGFPWDLVRIPWEGVQYVVVSQARKSELMALWKARQGNEGRNIDVVPPGIDPLKFMNVTDATARRVRDYALLDAVPLLLLPARLTRRKNIERAIEITAALCGQGWSAKLVVTGPPGPHNPANAAYLEKLQRMRESLGLEGAIVFLHESGAVDDASLRDLYMLADALLFPSEREGFGIPLLEAGLARLPIFCSDLSPFRETAGENAQFLSPEQSPQDAAKQIAAALARDPAFVFKQRVQREYNWERIFSERIEPLISA